MEAKMAIPDNIKEEIEVQATAYAIHHQGWDKDKFAEQYNDCVKDFIFGATQFYERGLAKRDELVKAAFEAGREGAELKGYDYKDEECDVFTGRMMTAKVVFDYSNYADFLASDEYKKLVGEE